MSYDYMFDDNRPMHTILLDVFITMPSANVYRPIWVSDERSWHCDCWLTVSIYHSESFARYSLLVATGLGPYA